jgi:hypothetical protein
VGLIYDGVISGFDSPSDQIDLAGLGFVSGQTYATSVLSGSNTILIVTNGSQTVALTLVGNQTSDGFVVSSDGSGPLRCRRDSVTRHEVLAHPPLVFGTAVAEF